MCRAFSKHHAMYVRIDSASVTRRLWRQDGWAAIVRNVTQDCAVAPPLADPGLLPVARSRAAEDQFGTGWRLILRRRQINPHVT